MTAEEFAINHEGKIVSEDGSFVRLPIEQELDPELEGMDNYLDRRYENSLDMRMEKYEEMAVDKFWE